MRKLFLVALLVSSQFVLADEPKPADQPSEKPAENKPAVEAAAKEKAQDAPLHEHPTLLRMLHKNNELRHRMGLRPHRIHKKLTQAAQDHANFMAATHSMDHYSNAGPQGRATRWGFQGGVLENIAMGQQSVEHVFNTWQNSGGHWASIISNTTDAGFGYQISASGTCFWCSVYGTDAGETVVVMGAGG